MDITGIVNSVVPISYALRCYEENESPTVEVLDDPKKGTKVDMYA